jgi:hypothetical protein
MPGKQILLPGQSKLGLAKSRVDAFNDYFYVRTQTHTHAHTERYIHTYTYTHTDTQ